MINTDFLKNEAAKMGVSLDGVAIKRFDLLAERLASWNSRVNLTAITEPDDIVVKHFLDSISPLPYADIKENARLIDVGCGAGFPGLPILIARPDLEVTFLDSIEKKLKFIDDELESTSLFGETVHGRAEVLGVDSDFREQFDVATTRAVAPLNVLAEYCLPLVKVGGIYISMKGAEDETALGSKAIKELGGEIENVVSLKLANGDSRNLIMIRKISQTATKYPRKTKKIAVQPL